MATLTDVFSPNGFNVYSLTSAIQKLPKQPSFIQSTGLFREIPVNTTTVAVEERDGALALIPTTARGGAGVPDAAENRNLRNFTVPHLQVDGFVLADQVTNVRAFGSEDALEGVQEVVNRQLDQAQRSIMATDEFLKIGALRGLINYPPNSVDADVNLFTAFGTTQQELDMDLGTAGTQQLLDNLPEISDRIEDALGNDIGIVSKIQVLCSREFFRNFIQHATVQQAYARFQAFESARPLDYVAPFRRRFTFDQFEFIEYYGNVSGHFYIAQDEAESDVHNEAVAYPVGPDIYHSYLSPADYVEAVGTMGQPIYTRPRIRQDGKGVILETQRNALNLCLRPRALIRLFSTT